MCLFRIGVCLETGLFQIKKLDLRGLRTGRSKGFIEKARRRATTDQDPIKLLTLGTSGELVDVDFRMTGKREDRRDDRENKPLGIKRKRLLTVTEKESPFCCHAVPYIPMEFFVKLQNNSSGSRRRAKPWLP